LPTSIDPTSREMPWPGRADAFADVAFDAKVVVAFAGAALRVGEVAARCSSLVGGLPGAQDFTDAAHGLAVAAHHADGAHVVQHVPRRQWFQDAASAKARSGNAGVQWRHTMSMSTLVER
jgi:hypothetical protein